MEKGLLIPDLFTYPNSRDAIASKNTKINAYMYLRIALSELSKIKNNQGRLKKSDFNHFGV